MTREGKKVKGNLTKSAHNFEKLLEIGDQKMILERIKDLGILILLSTNFNKDQISELRKS